MPSIVQIHLKQVYLTLCCVLVASALGAFFHLVWNIDGLLTFLGSLGSAALLLGMPPYEQKERLGLLMAASFFKGASVGPMVDLVLRFDLSILVTAFVGTALVFACFSMAAIFAKPREYLCIGSLLSSVISILFCLRFACIVVGGSHKTFYTERAQLGYLDYVKHAFELVAVFLAVFGRILVIVLNNSSEIIDGKMRRKRRA